MQLKEKKSFKKETFTAQKFICKSARGFLIEISRIRARNMNSMNVEELQICDFS